MTNIIDFLLYLHFYLLYCGTFLPSGYIITYRIKISIRADGHRFFTLYPCAILYNTVCDVMNI